MLTFSLNGTEEERQQHFLEMLDSYGVDNGTEYSIDRKVTSGRLDRSEFIIDDSNFSKKHGGKGKKPSSQSKVYLGVEYDLMEDTVSLEASKSQTPDFQNEKVSKILVMEDWMPKFRNRKDFAKFMALWEANKRFVAKKVAKAGTSLLGKKSFAPESPHIQDALGIVDSFFYSIMKADTDVDLSLVLEVIREFVYCIEDEQSLGNDQIV